MEIINIILTLLLINSLLIFKYKPQVLACGLVGFSGKDNFDINKILILMLANITRGKHSTGIYNDGIITKELGDAIDFFAKHELVPEHSFIGHDRWASIGIKSVENAHPFKYGSTVLVHNGTLTNHWDLVHKNDLNINDYDTDSQVIAKLISVDNTFSLLSKIEGSAALIWTDENDPERLYCFRNEERPLFYGKIDGNMYISSIENSLKIIGCSGIKEFKTNYLYSIIDGKIDIKNSKRIYSKKPKAPINYSYPVSYEYNYVRFTNTVDTFGSSIKLNGWYKITTNANPYVYSIYNIDGTFVRTMYKYDIDTHTDGIENAVEGDFVISVKTSENGLIIKDMLYIIQSLRQKEGTVQVSVMEVNSEDVITWSLSNFRPATNKEIDDFYLNNTNDHSIVLRTKDPQLSQELDLDATDVEIIKNNLIGMDDSINNLIEVAEESKTIILDIMGSDDVSVVSKNFKKLEDEVLLMSENVEELYNNMILTY